MATLHIRNIDAGLLKTLKISAIRQGLDLREFVIYSLTASVALQPKAEHETVHHAASCKCFICKPPEVRQIEVKDDSIKSKWIAAVTPYRKHADSCKCLMCKPPKEKP